MQNVHFHLTYLLTKHECVIVPDFGAFLVIAHNAKKETASGLWHSPGNSLSFNPNISHNDGLLANSIASEKNISFKEASHIIKKYVEGLTRTLNAGETVQLPWIGSFSLSPDRKAEFTPSVKLSCNHTFYGYSNFYLPPISELQKEDEYISEKEVALVPVVSTRRSVLKWAGTVAAIVALVLMAIPLNDHSERSDLHQASLISLPPVQEAAVVAEEETKPDETAQPLELPSQKIKTTAKYYFVVIASLPTLDQAERKVLEYKEEAFPQVSIVSKGDKHRVYVARFVNKEEANTYLDTFRTSHPKHSSAWLLSQSVTE